MGNCLKSPTSDDISLLRGAESGRESNASADPLGPPPPYQETAPVSYLPPNASGMSPPMSEEEQIKMAQRMGMIQHLPTGSFDGSKKNKECVICMVEFNLGDPVRFLPCMHIYHVTCIDDWLMRSFTCPSCLEPVDSALLTTYETS